MAHVLTRADAWSHERSTGGSGMHGTSRAKFGAVALATLAAVIAACGGGDGDDGGNVVSLSELKSHLPAAGDLGVKQRHEFEWNSATDLLVRGLVIPAAT